MMGDGMMEWSSWRRGISNRQLVCLCFSGLNTGDVSGV